MVEQKQKPKVYMYTPVEVTFDHNNPNYHKAVGMTEEQFKDLERRYEEMVKQNPAGSRSKFIEMIMDTFNPFEAMVIMENIALSRRGIGRITGVVGERGSLADMLRDLRDAGDFP